MHEEQVTQRKTLLTPVLYMDEAEFDREEFSLPDEPLEIKVLLENTVALVGAACLILAPWFIIALVVLTHVQSAK